MKKHIVSIAALLLCLVVSITAVMQITVNKQSYDMSGWQLEEGSDADVLFFGTSYVHYGILCGELWEQNGITAYNCGVDGQILPVTYWGVRAALDYVTPKVVVVDIFAASWWWEGASVESFHNTLDWLPLGKTKFEWAKTLPAKDRLEGLFPFLHYHSRWEELNKNDFAKEKHIFGGTSYSSVEKQLKQETAKKSEKGEVKEEFLQAVKDIIDYCRSRNIEVVFTVMPGSHTLRQQKALNTVIALGEQYGVETLDMHDYDVIDTKTDFYDMRDMGNDATASHINYSGAKKVTRFLGNWLQKKYFLPDHHGQADYARWEEKEVSYRQEKSDSLKEESGLVGTLVRLSDKDYSAAIIIPAGSHLEKDSTAKALLENLGLHPDWERIQNECYMGIADTCNDRVVELWNSGEYQWSDSKMSIEFSSDMAGTYTNPGVVCDGEDYSLRVYNELDEQPHMADIQVLALENQSGSVVCSKAYDQLPDEWEYRVVEIGQEQSKAIIVDD